MAEILKYVDGLKTYAGAALLAATGWTAGDPRLGLLTTAVGLVIVGFRHALQKLLGEKPAPPSAYSVYVPRDPELVP